MTTIELSLSGLCLTILGSLMAAIWKAGSLATKIEIQIDHLTTTSARLEAGIESLKQLPLLTQRVEQLEKHVPEINGRVTTIWTKMFSHDKHLAVIATRQSSPDIDPKDP
jgi:hypothetical protein